MASRIKQKHKKLEKLQKYKKTNSAKRHKLRQSICFGVFMLHLAQNYTQLCSVLSCAHSHMHTGVLVSLQQRTHTHTTYLHASLTTRHSLAPSTPAVARTRVYQNSLYTLAVAVVVLNFIATSMCNLPAHIHTSQTQRIPTMKFTFWLPKKTQRKRKDT